VNFAASPTELTTSVTDAVLAIECVVVLAWLLMMPSGNLWRAGLWWCVFGLLAFASLLGSIAHGIEMPLTWQAALWKPLNLTLGLVVALFMVGPSLTGRVGSSPGGSSPGASASAASFWE
jgi:hypothetical protein